MTRSAPQPLDNAQATIPRSRAWLLPLLLFACALPIAAYTLSQHLPAGQWLAAILHPSADRLPQLVVHYAWLPRFTVALLAGAGLALAGVIFQQVLRNPLAEPLTLGVAGGANLMLMGATIWLPLW